MLDTWTHNRAREAVLKQKHHPHLPKQYPKVWGISYYVSERRKLYVKNNYFAHDKPLWKDEAGDGSKYLLSTKNMLGTMLDPTDCQR